MTLNPPPVPPGPPAWGQQPGHGQPPQQTGYGQGPQQPWGAPPPPAPPPYGQQPAPGSPYGQPMPGRKRGMTPWIVGGCGCLLLLALFAGAIFMIVKAATADAEKVVDEFVAATGRGDYQAAYDHFSADLKEAQSFHEFSSAASDNSALFQVKDKTFMERSVKNNVANFSGTFDLVNGKEVPVSFTLVQVDDVWKLTAYEIRGD